MNARNFQMSPLFVCGWLERATYSLLAPLWEVRSGLLALDPGRPELLYQTGSSGLLFWATSEEVRYPRGYHAKKRPKVACGEDVGRIEGEWDWEWLTDWLIEGKREMARPLVPSLPAPSFSSHPSRGPKQCRAETSCPIVLYPNSWPTDE